MQLFSSLRSGLIALGMIASASTVQAEPVRIEYTITGFNETFTLNTTEGTIYYGIVLEFLISDDSHGGSLFFVDAPNVLFDFPGNFFSTNSGHPYDDGVDPPALWSGHGTSLEVVPGDSFPTIDGGRLSVSAVPEISTWAMTLSGFAALGFAGYRRRAASAA